MLLPQRCVPGERRLPRDGRATALIDFDHGSRRAGPDVATTARYWVPMLRSHLRGRVSIRGAGRPDTTADGFSSQAAAA